MAYEFKNLNEVPVQDAPTENTTVMAFEGGIPKQIPASEFGGKGLVVDLRAYTINAGGAPTVISDISYDPIYEAVTAGQNVVFRVLIEGSDTFFSPLTSVVSPGEGMAVLVVTIDGDATLLFTNGSYHPAEQPANEVI